MSGHCGQDDCACADSEYLLWLVEAAWFTAHPPQATEDKDWASRLETQISRYCNDNGLGEPWELYELRQTLGK